MKNLIPLVLVIAAGCAAPRVETGIGTRKDVYGPAPPETVGITPRALAPGTLLIKVKCVEIHDHEAFAGPFADFSGRRNWDPTEKEITGSIGKSGLRATLDPEDSLAFLSFLKNLPDVDIISNPEIPCRESERTRHSIAKLPSIWRPSPFLILPAPWVAVVATCSAPATVHLDVTVPTPFETFYDTNAVGEETVGFDMPIGKTAVVTPAGWSDRREKTGTSETRRCDAFLLIQVNEP